MGKVIGLSFVRYGGLSSVKQEGYRASMPTFHCPPARRGIYAFPYPYIERFLLGGSVFLPHRMEWIKDKDGNRIDSGFPYGTGHPDYAKLCERYMGCRECVNPEADEDDRDYNWVLAKHVKPRYFDYDGDLWHHLDFRLPRAAPVIAKKGSWVKTTMQVFKECLKKETAAIAIQKKRHGYGTSYDHLEVFIEKV
jgi:hypothetical protein